MTSLVLTVTETLRYRGALGQWSWVLHRITGLGVVFFVLLHVIDTSWAVFYPALYVEAIADYQTPLFTLGEFALVAAVVYHALNGVRVALLDFRPEWWKYQNRAALVVLGGSILILIPTFIGMFGHVLNFYSEERSTRALVDVIAGQARFVVGIGAAVVVAMLLSALHGLVTGNKAAVSSRGAERFWWSFMRVSGLIIIPLVFGHLAMMHLIQGVFDITAQQAAVGAGSAVGINETATAVEFVADRWNTLVAGVAIWRLYDVALLALVVIHGFNGLRYVFTDYAHNVTIRRGLVYLCIIGALVLLVLGGAALLVSVNDQAIKMAQEAVANLHLPTP